MRFQAIPKTDLRRCIAELASAIDCGEVHPEPTELAALVSICAARGLHAEAARLRRWLGQASAPPAGLGGRP